MRRERIIKIFTGPADEVERRANDFLAERVVVLADRVTIRHWGTDPVSLLIMVERNPDDPDVKAYNQEIAERVKAAKELGLA